LRLTQPPLQVVRGNHEAFNRLALNEPIHNLRDVGDRDAPVKKVIGFCEPRGAGGRKRAASAKATASQGG